MASEETKPVRVDAWLWAVRIFKTRGLATDECKAGHVRVNDEHVKPSQKLRIGDVVRVRYPGWEKVLKVEKMLAKRVGAPVAVTCYEDLSEPRPAYFSAGVPRRDRGTGRPTKLERRKLNDLRGYEKQ
ncbi:MULTISPECIES: RNA-binding S4 domain-containing protein [unclassified Rothia (in: high G+C Gram-positive bacteria)]|uniref:RNA-binding S4 domain-containing protein n=1 Tax=unclassified Rothia (in: high G+C Gram-positive bacteria) TaxID=2689056 RepID=UPI00195750A2|nr:MULTISPECIES: RNA-binding S4 domain-containing protein [unclassified Rothia (in: high G+C Gram-positive bacteria)]MBM7051739.1 RNA-binding S4 domain-containing protein [Rothia sp. ZJ1223]QRZ61641.1 RNA-binding S4 domain-containing protein [Rothia sp. ZJ932]